MAAPRLTHSSAVVLQAIAKGYRHGFDITEVTGLPGGTIYPALRRMERQALVRSAWEPVAAARAEKRPPRRYYVITSKGQEALDAALARFLFLQPFAAQLPAKGGSG